MVNLPVMVMSARSEIKFITLPFPVSFLISAIALVLSINIPLIVEFLKRNVRYKLRLSGLKPSPSALIEKLRLLIKEESLTNL